MQTQLNHEIQGQHGKSIFADAYYCEDKTPKPVVIFCHGFKGFKDWGTFGLLAEKFAHEGFCFVKFNFSHGGVTPDKPDEFSDLEAFGNNNFSIELDDVGTVINHVLEEKSLIPTEEMDGKELYLLGHSRGGGIAILKAREDERVKKIATWASVNEFGQYWSEDVMRKWKEEGVQYVENKRTGQRMPMNFQIYEDYFSNLDRLHIPTAVKELKIPFLIVHGTDDEAVPYLKGQEMAEWYDKSKLLTIEGGDHTFGGKHPWETDQIPDDLQHVVEETIRFFKD